MRQILNIHAPFLFLTALGSICLMAEEPGNKKYLIIHADDAGMSHSVNRATIEAMENGLVSSASIMVPCSWFSEFAEYAREHPAMDFGVHLTLNSEWSHYRWGPVAPREQVSSLIDEDGYLWDNVAQVAAHVKADEVEIELRAQIERARQFGVPLSHLDTHMGALFSREDLVEVYLRLGIEYDLPVLFIRDAARLLAKEYPALADKAEDIVRRLDQHQLLVLDHVVQYYDGNVHEERKKIYLEALGDLESGVSEFLVHCGYDDEELRGITNSSGLRDSDRQVFTDPRIAAQIDRLGIEVTNWRRLRE